MNTLQKAMIQALQANLGIVSKACRAAGVCRASHYKWLQQWACQAAGCPFFSS